MTLELNDVIVSPEWLSAHLDDVVVVDVRDHSVYRKMGHIPGAVNILYGALRYPGYVAEGILPETSEIAGHLEAVGISAADTVVAYDGAKGVYAARFLLTAAVYGHDGDLHLLNGDYSVWRLFFETETDEPTVISTTYQIDRSSSPRVVDRETDREATESATTLVDTRIPAEYEAAHIPGAGQLGWETLVDDATHQIRSPEEIETILEDRGISRDQNLILYCNTVRRLSHTFAVLHDQGFENVRFYEGSLTDWVRAESPDWNPQELYENVCELVSDGVERMEAELGEDIFGRTHLIGLYTQKQDEHSMLWTKVPCGTLTAGQARTFGEIAKEFATTPPEHGGSDQNPEFGDGFLDITTLQGLQLHWIRIEDLPEIWDRYAECGLTTIQASGDTLRNLVTCPASGPGEDLTDDYRGGHVGVNEQGDGRYYVGINVPTGRMHGQGLIRLADLAEEYGSTEFRTTNNQNLLLPDVAGKDLEDLLSSPVFDRYSPDPGPFERGIVTCTSAEFCGYGVVETKIRGLRWARDLDRWLTESDLDAAAFPNGIGVHMSGCSASCAQPQVADFGLRGERHRGEVSKVSAADIGVGSDLAAGEFIDWVAGSVPLSEVPDAIKGTLRAYQRDREAGESFKEWANCQSLTALRQVIGRDDGAVAVGSEVR